MAAAPTTKHSIARMDGNDPGSTIDDTHNSAVETIDAKMAVYDAGLLTNRPAAGKSGRLYRASDGPLALDTGTQWEEIARGSPAELAQRPVLDTGVAGHTRAGRQLTVADFTDLGLSQPIGLWNLSALTNLGSDGRALTNKGAVPFGKGITGAASEAAVFAGATSQALYIADSGAADPFRIRTGSWGCWFRTAKRGVNQVILAKLPTSGAGADCWLELLVTTTNAAQAAVQLNLATGVSDVCDDRWHFAVATYDGTMVRLYVDGVLEAAFAAIPGAPANPGPLNIGGYGADASTAAGLPVYGRVDETFVTADVLSEDQIRILYAVKLAHGLGSQPRDARVNVRRRRKGAALATGDFTTTPLRLHNFTGGALTDQGSGNVALTNNGTAVSVAGADGSSGGAFSFAGAQSLSATDTGLPSGTAPRSYGCWFKVASVASYGLLGWGAGAAAAAGAWLGTSAAGAIMSISGADQVTGIYATDAQWHFAVAVEDSTAADGLKRKLYLDGRLVAASTVLNSIALAGANRFRVGANPDGTAPLTGQIDGAFVCGYAMAPDEIQGLYAKGGVQQLAASPKNAGDHIEALDATNLYVICDTLESQHLIDLGVAM